jgi:hypothetical protein
VSGHVVFLGGHDATHQDESLVVHVIPFRSGVGYGQRRRRDRVREPARSRGRATYCSSAAPSHCAAFLGRDHPGQHETVAPAGGLSSPPANHHGVAGRPTRCVEVERPILIDGTA